jgi:hypothetical protein
MRPPTAVHAPATIATTTAAATAVRTTVTVVLQVRDAKAAEATELPEKEGANNVNAEESQVPSRTARKTEG